MAAVAELAVRISADIAAFEKGMGNMSRSMQNASKKLGDISKTMTKNVTLPMVALGSAAMAAANEMDKGYNAIRRGTGATGEALKALQGEMKEVMRVVPQGAEAVGQAVADLNTRTGLTGDALRNMTEQMLNLGRITGEDVSGIIASTTRVFGDWDIATAKQAGTLDYLFKVSQATGIGVGSLSQKVVQFGAPMRQMGFDFETTAALMGKFEKEGVNTELVVGSLRIALGKMAKEGISDPSRALQVLIRRIQEAGTAGRANAIALEAFGARAGADMAAAIREGRFEIEQLLKDLAGSEETINAAARETLTFADHMAMLKNEATIALEPLGRVLLDLFQDSKPFLEWGIGKLEELSNWFGELDENTRSNYLKVLGGVLVAGPLLGFFSTLIGLLSKAVGLFGAIGGAGAGSAAGAGVGMSSMGVAAAVAAGKVALLVAALAGAGYGAVKLRDWMNAGLDFNPETGMYDNKKWGQPAKPAPMVWLDEQTAISSPKGMVWMDEDKVLSFGRGGIVPGPRGFPQLAVVHGGETILPTHKKGAGNEAIALDLSGQLEVVVKNDRGEIIGIATTAVKDLLRREAMR